MPTFSLSKPSFNNLSQDRKYWVLWLADFEGAPAVISAAGIHVPA